jgi:hypothetical protein
VATGERDQEAGDRGGAGEGDHGPPPPASTRPPLRAEPPLAPAPIATVGQLNASVPVPGGSSLRTSSLRTLVSGATQTRRGRSAAGQAVSASKAAAVAMP